MGNSKPDFVAFHLYLCGFHRFFRIDSFTSTPASNNRLPGTPEGKAPLDRIDSTLHQLENRYCCPDLSKYGPMLMTGAMSMFCTSSALCATI